MYVLQSTLSGAAEQQGGGGYTEWEDIKIPHPCLKGKVNKITNNVVNRPLAHDVIAPVTMHLEDKLAIYA
jgi:hypothetical protein